MERNNDGNAAGGRRMTMVTYETVMPWGETLRISADLTQAAATIYYSAGDGGDEEQWVCTPYQTADARHRAHNAVMLVIGYLGRSWYAAPDDERDDDAILAEIGGAIELEVLP
jgi:hypothetical protein